MKLSTGSFLSQDDSNHSGCTPSDQDVHKYNDAAMVSPQNRKKRGRFFAIFGKSNADNNETEPSHFNMSQDDSNQRSLSQFSYDFTERLGGLSMKASQDFSSHPDNSRSNFSYDENSHQIGSNSNSSISNRTSKFIPFSTVNASSICQTRFSTNREVPVFSTSSWKRPSSELQPNSSSDIAAALAPQTSQKQITIAPAITNIFLREKENLSRYSNQSKLRRKSTGTNLWIAAFKERPRYSTDYEHVGDLGSGTFSSVYCARRRLDGILYAVKRIKRKISGESEGKLVIKESCAHAALAGCPHLIQYFGCWLDDGHLHIQTEYCDHGSMDCFVLTVKDRGRDELSSKSHTSYSVNLAAGSSQSSSTSDFGSMPSVFEKQNEQDEVQSFSCRSNLIKSSSVQPGICHDSVKVDPLSSCTRTQNTLFSEGIEEVCSTGNPDDNRHTPKPLIQRSQNCFSEAMQGVGEDSQNSDSYSCFSENCSVNGMTGMLLNDDSNSSGNINKDSQMPGMDRSDEEEEEDLNMNYPSKSVEEELFLPSIRTGMMTEDLAWIVLKCLGRALNFMHTKGMAHLDLRPANIFIKRNPDMSDVPLPGSFGRDSSTVSTIANLLVSEDLVMKLGDLGHVCGWDETNWIEGESRYCSKELIVTNDGQTLDLRQADIFSLGASVYEMCLGRELGSGETVEWHSIRDGVLDDCFASSFSQSLVLFVKRLLHPTPTLRPSAKEIMAYASLPRVTIGSVFPEIEGVIQIKVPEHAISPCDVPASVSLLTSLHTSSAAKNSNQKVQKLPERSFAHIFPLSP